MATKHSSSRRRAAPSKKSGARPSKKTPAHHAPRPRASSGLVESLISSARMSMALSNQAASTPTSTPVPSSAARSPLAASTPAKTALAASAPAFSAASPRLTAPLSGAAPASPTSVKLSDAQTLEMLELGKQCYSLFGQTRMFWSKLKPPYSNQSWLRFHFLQASLISWAFIFVYVLSAALSLLGWLGGFFVLPPFWAEGLFLLALLSHLLLFNRLGAQAGDGKVPNVPFFGDRAARLAASEVPLASCKF